MINIVGHKSNIVAHLAGDLSEDHDHASVSHSLTGHLGVGILLQVSIQDGVRYLVTHLVRVTLPDTLRGEQDFLILLRVREEASRVSGGGRHVSTRNVTRCLYLCGKERCNDQTLPHWIGFNIQILEQRKGKKRVWIKGSVASEEKQKLLKSLVMEQTLKSD